MARKIKKAYSLSYLTILSHSAIIGVILLTILTLITYAKQNKAINDIEDGYVINEKYVLLDKQ